jgi:hypothetical protein
MRHLCSTRPELGRPSLLHSRASALQLQRPAPDDAVAAQQPELSTSSCHVWRGALSRRTFETRRRTWVALLDHEARGGECLEAGRRFHPLCSHGAFSPLGARLVLAEAMTRSAVMADVNVYGILERCCEWGAWRRMG